MLYKLTAGMKNIVDTALGAVGLVAGIFVSNASSLSGEWQIVAAIGGTIVGYFASDAITYVDTGTVPVNTIETQISNLWINTAKPKILAEIQAKVPANEQVIATEVLSIVEAQLYAAAGIPAPKAA
jgi:hypothetical protein